MKDEELMFPQLIYENGKLTWHLWSAYWNI